MSNEPGPTARTEALINLAEKLASQPLPPPEQPRKWPVVVAGVAVAVILVGGIALIAARGGGDDTADQASETLPETSGTDAIRTSESSPSTTEAAPATEPVATEPTAPVSTAPVSTAPATTDAASTSTSTSTTSTSSSVATTTTDAPTVTPGADDPVRWAEFSGGKVYLRGRVPDQATADEVREKAAAVVGEANVVVEYDIVPGTPRPSSAPLYVRDSVLFARNSSAITDSSRGVLDLGVALMSQNPQVTIDIQGHTDADGTEEDNLELSQERVDSIFDYMVSKGVDPGRLTRHAFGESQPIADNVTDEGKALNRRVEFTISNLIG